MNKWQCDHPGCDRTVVGCGGAVGLRAIGWWFKPGPDIFCPEHRPDVSEHDCKACVADLEAWYHQETIRRSIPSDLRPVLVFAHLHELHEPLVP